MRFFEQFLGELEVTVVNGVETASIKSDFLLLVPVFWKSAERFRFIGRTCDEFLEEAKRVPFSL